VACSVSSKRPVACSVSSKRPVACSVSSKRHNQDGIKLTKL
jgi:Fe-S-cluster containining protein